MIFYRWNSVISLLNSSRRFVRNVEYVKRRKNKTDKQEGRQEISKTRLLNRAHLPFHGKVGILFVVVFLLSSALTRAGKVLIPRKSFLLGVYLDAKQHMEMKAISSAGNRCKGKGSFFLPTDLDYGTIINETSCF